MSNRERLMKEINEMPDEDIANMIKMWNHFLWMERERAQEKQAPSPWDTLRKYRGSVHAEEDFDYKTELARYRDERYANPG